LDSSLKIYIGLLASIYSESTNNFNDYSISISNDTWFEFANIFKIFEQYEHLNKSIVFFGEHINSIIMNQIILRFIDLTKKFDSKSYIFHCSNFLLTFDNYDGMWSEELIKLISDIFEQLDEIMKNQIGASLKKSIINNLISNISVNNIDENSNKLIFIKFLPYISPDKLIFQKIYTLMDEKTIFWRICEIVSIYSNKLELINSKDIDSLKTLFIPKLNEKLKKNPNWLLLNEEPNQEETKSMYYALKALTFLNYEKRNELLSIALTHKDYRIRRIAGAGYIKNAESSDLEKLVIMITNTSLPKTIKRGGEGGEKYRLRQTIYEMLQMVMNDKLRVSKDVIYSYNKNLKSATEKRLNEVENIYISSNDPGNREYRNPDIYDEDLTTLLLLLLSSVESWDNIDVFLRVLKEPFSLIGAYDITEAGVVAIMKLASTNKIKLTKADEKKIKEALANCFAHKHNGVSGRAAKVLQWLGNQEDLNILQLLESNTVKNLRENSLLSREAILTKAGDNWGNDFASDSIAPIWS